MLDGLAGKVAFVTGAARGQGRSHAVRLAQEGADLVLCDACAPIDAVEYDLPTLEDLQQTAKLVEEHDRRALVRQVDVRDRAALDGLVDEARTTFGRLDVIVANAGVASYRGWEAMTDELWREVIDINLTGAWLSVRAALPLLLEGGAGGSVILTSSAAGQLGLPGLSHYVSAKHGVVGLMRALANELGGQGVRVNAVLPGTVNTDMAANDATYALFRPDLEHPTEADVRDIMVGLNLLPVQWVEAADISAAVAWLASDQARYVTGVALPVDAGYVAKAF